LASGSDVKPVGMKEYLSFQMVVIIVWVENMWSPKCHSPALVKKQELLEKIENTLDHKNELLLPICSKT
jgi:hypothetical protein